MNFPQTLPPRNLTPNQSEKAKARYPVATPLRRPTGRRGTLVFWWQLGSSESHAEVVAQRRGFWGFLFASSFLDASIGYQFFFFTHAYPHLVVAQEADYPLLDP